MASATPTAAMNAAMATSSTGAALDFLPMGATTSVGAASSSRPRGAGSAAAPRPACRARSNGPLRARGGGERCSVVRASSSGGTGSNGLRRCVALGEGPIGVGTLATGAPATVSARLDGGGLGRRRQRRRRCTGGAPRRQRRRAARCASAPRRRRRAARPGPAATAGSPGRLDDVDHRQLDADLDLRLDGSLCFSTVVGASLGPRPAPRAVSSSAGGVRIVDCGIGGGSGVRFGSSGSLALRRASPPPRRSR